MVLPNKTQQSSIIYNIKSITFILNINKERSHHPFLKNKKNNWGWGATIDPRRNQTPPNPKYQNNNIKKLIYDNQM